ncbi:MAG: prepilin peptidase [Ilumatobacteraceae bacterium]
MLAAVATGLCALVGVTWPLTSIAVSLALVALVVAALVDVVEHRLPNALVGLGLVPVVLCLAAAGSSDLLGACLLGAALLGGPLLVTHLASPAGMGFGDVKAGAVAGAAVGLIDPQLAVLALVLGLATAATWGLLRRSRTVPFGPGLVAGSLAALVVGRFVGIEAVIW